MSDKTLGDYGEYDGGEIGEVDLFGLDEFGQPVGMNPMWGSVIGGGLSTGAAIAVRALTEQKATSFAWTKWSEGIGFGVGALASGAMMAFPATRAAGWASLATAFVTSGLRQVELLLSKNAWQMSGPSLGIPMVEQIQGFGIPSIERLSGPSLGVPTIENLPPVAGAQLSSAPPVDLMDTSALPASAHHVETINGPDLSGLGAHYGATLFGSNN